MPRDERGGGGGFWLELVLTICLEATKRTCWQSGAGSSWLTVVHEWGLLVEPLLKSVREKFSQKA